MKKDKTINLKRLQEYLSLLGETNKERADAIGCDTSTVTKFWNGDRQPSVEMLKTICTKCNCSIDYLFNLSDTKTNDIEIKAISDKLSLSEDAIEYLQYLSKNKKERASLYLLKKIDLINAIFNSDNDILDDFDNVLSQISEYLYACTRMKPYSEEYILDNLHNEFANFSKLEFDDLLKEIELHRIRITKSIEAFVDNLTFTIVYDYDEGEYIDFHSAITNRNSKFASFNEVVKHNQALFEKYELELMRNFCYEDAQIMLYEEKIKRAKELKQYIDLLKSKKDGEADVKQENT